MTIELKITAIVATTLFAALLALKLTHVIGWSWLWVIAPLWLPGLILVCLWAYVIFLMVTDPN